MKKVGITQRVVHVPGRGERRDALDQRWYRFADTVGIILVPIPNGLKKPVEFATTLNLEGLIYSGGNNVGFNKGKQQKKLNLEHDDVAFERDHTEADLLEWAIDYDIPVIGVCRGLQFINCHLGGTLIEVNPKNHVATKHRIEFVDLNWKNWYGEEYVVNSYHDWGIKPDNLSVKLLKKGLVGPYIEAFSHKQKNIHGIMWHPERYKEIKKSDVDLFKFAFHLS